MAFMALLELSWNIFPPRSWASLLQVSLHTILVLSLFFFSNSTTQIYGKSKAE